MGEAINYALHLLPQLEVYLNDGRILIDNNPVENAIRPTAIGKKNWLFIGEAEAGQRAAILYTLIDSCRTHGLDPFAWLRDVLTRLPTFPVRRIHELTPAACAKAARTKAARTKAACAKAARTKAARTKAARTATPHAA